MPNITIPASLDEATDRLVNIDGLVSARQWERAAIVYAFTESTGGRSRKDREKPNFREFAQRGIAGLRDPETVAEYHQRWATAVADGDAEPAVPGAKVTMPTIKWPGRQDPNGKRRYAEKTSTAFVNALDKGEVDPEVFAQDLDDELARTIVARLVEDRPELVEDELAKNPPRRPQPVKERPDSYDLIADLHRTHDLTYRIMQAVADGRAKVATDEILEEVHWQQNAWEMIESGISGGSLDEALARMTGGDR